MCGETATFIMQVGVQFLQRGQPGQVVQHGVGELGSLIHAILKTRVTSPGVSPVFLSQLAQSLQPRWLITIQMLEKPYEGADW